MVGDGDDDTPVSPDVTLERRDHKNDGRIKLTRRQPDRGNIARSVFKIKILTITTIVVKPKDRIQLPNHK